MKLRDSLAVSAISNHKMRIAPLAKRSWPWMLVECGVYFVLAACFIERWLVAGLSFLVASWDHRWPPRSWAAIETSCVPIAGFGLLAASSNPCGGPFVPTAAMRATNWNPYKESRGRPLAL